MKKRNCVKILCSYLERRCADKCCGKTVHATWKEIKAYRVLSKCKPNHALLYLIHENGKGDDLSVFIGG